MKSKRIVKARKPQVYLGKLRGEKEMREVPEDRMVDEDRKGVVCLLVA